MMKLGIIDPNDRHKQLGGPVLGLAQSEAFISAFGMPS